jgi:hypothetical protein
MDVEGSRNRVALFEVAQCGRPLGRAALLGTLRDTLGLLFLGAGGYKKYKSVGPGTMVR